MSRVMRKVTQRPTGAAGEATLLVHALAVFALILFVPVVIISVFPLQNSSSLKGKVLKEKEVSSDVEIGPWGGDQGGVNPMRFVPDGRISGIRISTGDCVNSIRFTYTDHAGVKHHSDTYGGDGGSPKTITFDDDENLIRISGTFGAHRYSIVITSLSFVTNKKNYGSFGTFRGPSFSLPVTKGRFAGFSGRYGDYLESFGVILHPN